MTPEEQQLRAIVENAVARNASGRDEFTSKAKSLQQILLSGTEEDLNEFIDRLAPDSTGAREGDGEDLQLGEAGSS